MQKLGVFLSILLAVGAGCAKRDAEKAQGSAKNKAGTAPADASKLYSKNVLNFLKLIIDKDGKLNLNFEDDLVKGTCIATGGNIVNERVASMMTVNS